MCKIFSEKIMELVILAIVSILDCDQFENYVGTGNLIKGNPTELSDGLSVPDWQCPINHGAMINPSLRTIDHIIKLLISISIMICVFGCKPRADT